jgi:hypothetical protein
MLEKNFPNVANFYTELSNVEDGSKGITFLMLVGIPAIRSAVNVIRDNLKTLNALLEILEKERAGPSKPKFTQVMQKFSKDAEQNYAKLSGSVSDSENKFEQAVIFFGEDPKATSPEEFFGVFANFCKAYLDAKRENELVNQKLEHEKKREEAKKECDFLM